MFNTDWRLSYFSHGPYSHYFQDKKRTDEKNERSSMDRHSRDRDATSESKESREQMPPPNSRRTSTEPSDDKGNNL
jgi:hypothetical protein